MWITRLIREWWKNLREIGSGSVSCFLIIWIISCCLEISWAWIRWKRKNHRMVLSRIMPRRTRMIRFMMRMEIWLNHTNHTWVRVTVSWIHCTNQHWIIKITQRTRSGRIILILTGLSASISDWKPECRIRSVRTSKKNLQIRNQRFTMNQIIKTEKEFWRGGRHIVSKRRVLTWIWTWCSVITSSWVVIFWMPCWEVMLLRLGLKTNHIAW